MTLSRTLGYTCTALLFFSFCRLDASARALKPVPVRKQNSAIVIVPMDLSGPRPTVFISINGGAKQNAVFDTGAMNTVINIDQIESLGLNNDGALQPPFDKHSMGGGFQTSIKSLRIGEMELNNLSLPALAIPLLNFAAVISPNSFSRQLITLDFAQAQLRVQAKSAEVEPTTSAYQYSALPFSVPTMPVNIDGQVVNAHLDTGSPVGLIFPLSYESKLKFSQEKTLLGHARTAHPRQFPIYRAVVKGKIKVGPLTLQDPEIRLSDVVPVINVGTAILKQVEITLDPENKRLWVVPKVSLQPPHLE